MKIAVTSQNRKTITEHAGKCRKFWVYEVIDQQIQSKQLLELPIDQSFHESAHASNAASPAHPLDGISLLIAGSLGHGLQNRLKQKGIQAIATSQTDPDQAVAAWLNGDLAEISAEMHDGHHEHGHHHGDHDEVPAARAKPGFIVSGRIGKFDDHTISSR